MVLARVASYFSSTAEKQPDAPLNYIDHGFDDTTRRAAEMSSTDIQRRSPAKATDMDHENYRPPYAHAMLAGGLGGCMGDMLMHSLDTVKTRQQGDPHMPPKYTSMGNTYWTILRQEGVGRGLYGGVTPAFVGSFLGTVLFFGCYEKSKRAMIDYGVTPSVAYFMSGWCADLAASPLYVPTEVLKTRLQLQGSYNNPYFTSGYNYRSTMHAFKTIYRTEGWRELFSGYKATLLRDLPFSALQFTFYELGQKWSKNRVGPGQDIGLWLEIGTGAFAGGAAGFLTCPMDVVKTRIQTELDPAIVAKVRQKAALGDVAKKAASSAQAMVNAATKKTPNLSSPIPSSRRSISTSGPGTALKHHGLASLDTESVYKALKIIYRTEGIAGWFRGVAPRTVWTGIQSGVMLLAYQKLLRYLNANPLVRLDPEDGLRGIS